VALEAPPQNLYAEEYVLGALLWGGPTALAEVKSTGLRAEDFYYRERHGWIFEAIEAVTGRGAAADTVLVADELRRLGELDEVGGLPHLAELSAMAFATGNAPHHARLVRDAAERRAQYAASLLLGRAAHNGGLAGQPELQEELRRLIDHRSAAGSLVPLDLAELLASPPPAVGWRWQGWLARGDLALLVGEPGVGKSLLALALAASLRLGDTLLGDDCRRCRVGIVDLENPLDEVHKRLRAFGISADDNDGLLYWHAQPLDLADGTAAIATIVQEHALDVLMIDSLRRATPGLDENDSAAVSAVLSPLRALTHETGCTILLLHHVRKQSGGSADAAQTVRGSGDLVASADSLLVLRPKEQGLFAVEHAKARRGMPHDSVIVRIDDNEGRITLVNEGPAGITEDKVGEMLAKIVSLLSEYRRPLARQELARGLGTDPKHGTFTRALERGCEHQQLLKPEREKRTDPQLYALNPDYGNGSE
jgi:replicative DNA helicase